MKKRKILASLLAVATAFCSLAGCAGAPENGVIEDNPLAEARVKLEQFDYGDVKLTDGLFKDVYDGCLEYYGTLTADDILYCWREAAQMDTGSGRDLGWVGTRNSECCIAQLISAKARRYAATGKEEDLQTVRDLLEGFQEIVEKSGTYPRMWSQYFYEKTMRALIDIYTLCGLEGAYDMACDLLSYGQTDSYYAQPKKQLGNNGSDECEWYTMSEALYLFADVAQQKGESASLVRRCRDMAKLYEYTEFWDIFYNEENLFDYKPEVGSWPEYFHAYSHVNSFNSALAAYETNGNEYYLDATQKFWDWMKSSQRLATGGYGLQYEWLLPTEKIVDYMQTTHNTTETQCTSYAVVNLDNRLMRYTLDASYGQWTEDVFYNMTIGSLETKDGKADYYSDYNTSGGVKQVRDDWAWACCAGTRPLVVLEYLRSIYFHDTRNLYVNLYTNSEVTFETESSQKITLAQQSDFPQSENVNFTLGMEGSAEFSLRFRKPDWLAADATVQVNGEKVSYSLENGWITLRRTWQDGDAVTLTLPMELRFSSIVCEDYDNYAVYAVSYGPVTLACEGAHADLNQSVLLEKSPAEQLEATETPLTFRVKGNESLVFKPYYEYKDGDIYTLYMCTASL